MCSASAGRCAANPSGVMASCAASGTTSPDSVRRSRVCVAVWRFTWNENASGSRASGITMERGDEPRDARLDAADVVSREPVTEQAEERGLGLWIERVPARGGSADGLTAQLDGSAGTHHRIRSVRRLDPRLSTGDHGWRHLDGWPIGAGVVDARLLADRHRPALARVRRPSLPPIAIAGSTSAACHLCPTSCTARTVAAAPTLARASRLPENTAPPRGVRRARWPAISNAMPTQIAITSIARRWSGSPPRMPGLTRPPHSIGARQARSCEAGSRVRAAAARVDRPSTRAIPAPCRDVWPRQ